MHANNERPGFYVQPPWIEYPESDPTWGGWRQGESENWFCNVWLPFWERLKPKERILYLKNWTPPKDWNLYLTQY
ncbi:hypothetical protein LEP1GSC021_4616 [Leptospira noguchii str. 1993005606]|uniref:Uncharacterized protein n=1 Tax=Leptospira noguchii str. 2007001578 TaxID=1049974 RepID=A0ABP2T9B4_9LEPT|nr:hypothetical protein [Leptospira noguchii]EMN00882.1 hypothetical protein LEP1GSC035_1387 [Leptospira noguchii str. 2007001578]EPE84832.1 hypothetical protein LEP1GSC021_4616 [Leptospira noguchii str. 1993005606]